MNTSPGIIVKHVAIFALSEHEDVFPNEIRSLTGLAQHSVLLALLLDVVELRISLHI